MSDHISGPRALADPIADITDVYAFPSPKRPGHLVLVQNTLPFAQPSSLFSDGLVYRFRLRPLTPVGDGAAPFAVGLAVHPAHHRLQQLPCILKVTLPQQRRAFTGLRVGGIGLRRVVSRHHAFGRRDAGFGAPARMVFIAAVGPGQRRGSRVDRHKKQSAVRIRGRSGLTARCAKPTRYRAFAPMPKHADVHAGARTVRP